MQIEYFSAYQAYTTSLTYLTKIVFLIAFLTECFYGSYGVDCKQNCPGKCKNNVTCDPLTGLCNGGCAAGWNGSYCNKSNDRRSF